MNLLIEAAARQLSGYMPPAGDQNAAEESCDALQALERQLTEIPEVSGLCGLHMIALGQSNSTPLTLRGVAIQLAYVSIRTSAAQAIAGLLQVISTNSTRVTINALLSGITTEAECNLTDAFKIRPFIYNDAPVGLTSFQRPQPGAIVEWLRPTPHSILTLEVTHSPAFVEAGSAPPPWPNEEIASLLSVASSLSVIAEHEVAVMEMWIDTSDSRLPITASTITFSNPAWGLGPVQEPVVLDVVGATRFLNQLKKVHVKHRAAIGLGMTRLNRARRAARLDDRAIELGIAAEVLLMHDISQSNQEISHKLGMRAAYLLEDSPSDRQQVFKQMSKIYSRRSGAVHRGLVDIREDDQRTWMDSQNDCDLVGRIIKRVVENGGFPQWLALTMGGSYILQ